MSSKSEIIFDRKGTERMVEQVPSALGLLLLRYLRPPKPSFLTVAECQIKMYGKHIQTILVVFRANTVISDPGTLRLSRCFVIILPLFCRGFMHETSHPGQSLEKESNFISLTQIQEQRVAVDHIRLLE